MGIRTRREIDPEKQALRVLQVHFEGAGRPPRQRARRRTGGERIEHELWSGQAVPAPAEPASSPRPRSSVSPTHSAQQHGQGSQGLPDLRPPAGRNRVARGRPPPTCRTDVHWGVTEAATLVPPSSTCRPGHTGAHANLGPPPRNTSGTQRRQTTRTDAAPEPRKPRTKRSTIMNENWRRVAAPNCHAGGRGLEPRRFGVVTGGT